MVGGWTWIPPASGVAGAKSGRMGEIAWFINNRTALAAPALPLQLICAEMLAR